MRRTENANDDSVSEKDPIFGMHKMTPSQIIAQIVSAMDDQLDDRRPQFSSSADVGAIVIIIGFSDMTTNLPSLKGAIEALVQFFGGDNGLLTKGMQQLGTLVTAATGQLEDPSKHNVKFKVEDIRKFLFSTRFLFQNLDRVILFDNQFNLIGDTDTLDLDPRSFSTRLDTVELEILNEKKTKEITEKKNIDIGNDYSVSLNDVLINYAGSKNFGIPFTFTQEEFNKFKLTTIKNVMQNGKNIGYLAITENANDIKAAINERKTFIIRTAIAVGIVILIFSFAVSYTHLTLPTKRIV